MATASDHAASPVSGEGGARNVGMVTRVVSWVIDALIINFVAIMAGLGAALVLSIFPLGKNAEPVFEAIAGGVYVVWAAAYFVALWSIAGQTVGARVMQIRLVAPRRRRVKPGRALVRWVGMNLAMLPLFAGYLPIAFGRRGFPDWLARTLVVEAPQVSVAQAGRAALRSARAGAGRRPAAVLPESAPSAPMVGDGRTAPRDSPRTTAPI